MTLLGLDIGSSSVKAGLLRDGLLTGDPAREAFPTRYDGAKAEVDAAAIFAAVHKVIADLGPDAKTVDAVALSVMCPAFVLIDTAGKPLTPIVTHQDRRSVEQAVRIEQTVGKGRHLQLAGNRPTPGGISSTTFAWFAEHHPDVVKRADLFGHLNTLLVRTLTGARTIDPSNASFTGLYETTTLGGWSDVLCDAAGVPKAILPDVIDADRIAGTVTAGAAESFGLAAGTPVLAGYVDGSGATLLGGAAVGLLVNTAGSTDVLALCVDDPKPADGLLTRGVGVGRKWLSVATLSAAGSSVAWAKAMLYPHVDWPAFDAELRKAAAPGPRSPVRFDPRLAGDRAAVQQPTGGFAGLTLATTRGDLLRAVADALAADSADRLKRLMAQGIEIHSEVIASGRGDPLTDLLHRDWPGHWTFREENEASLRGLGTLTPKPR